MSHTTTMIVVQLQNTLKHGFLMLSFALFAIILTMSLDIESQYNQNIEKLKNGLRPLQLYSTEEGQLLKDKLDSFCASKTPDETELKQVLCLLLHGQCHGIDFSLTLLKIIQMQLSTDLMIFSLSASIKWVVEFNQKNGHPITLDFMNIIKKILEI